MNRVFLRSRVETDRHFACAVTSDPRESLPPQGQENARLVSDSNDLRQTYGTQSQKKKWVPGIPIAGCGEAPSYQRKEGL